MYYVIVICLMFVFPALSIAVDVVLRNTPASVLVFAKWLVFWTVGVRLLLAGTRQIMQPRYTAQTILGINGNESLLLVRELGFANVAIGLIGTLSLARAQWLGAAALAGGVFYVLAGVNHAMQPHRNRLQAVAMGTDLFAGVALLGASVCMAIFS